MKDQPLERESFSVGTPDGKAIPLATQKEYAEANSLRAPNARARTVRDSPNYFPAEVTKAGAFQFFADLGTPGSRLSFDEVGLSYDRASIGHLFFRIPGGIRTGQHGLVVKLEASEVHLPFRILTEEEEKAFRKQWDDLKKALDEGLLRQGLRVGERPAADRRLRPGRLRGWRTSASAPPPGTLPLFVATLYHPPEFENTREDRG